MYSSSTFLGGVDRAGVGNVPCAWAVYSSLGAGSADKDGNVSLEFPTAGQPVTSTIERVLRFLHADGIEREGGREWTAVQALR